MIPQLPATLRRFADDAGATLAEFAFGLPFLVVVLYAVFDFGGALTLKQKLGASVYGAARVAAGQSTGDLSSTTITGNGSIANIRDLVARSLQGGSVNDCGLLGAAPTSNTGFTWVFSVNSGCPAAMVLTIDRQQVVQVTSGGTVYNVIYTHVKLDYPFRWRLSQVIQLLVPGGTFPTAATITVEASMPNLT